jgi:hypothetical protein
MNRRQALGALLAALTPSSLVAANPTVSTLIGTGSRGYSDREVNNPYGLVIGPDRALYFCDLDNQRIRRLDLKTRQTTTVAGNGQRAYGGDGGSATAAALNMPHEIQFDSAGNIFASLTALPSIPAASCSSATSGTTAFVRSIFPPA